MGSGASSLVNPEAVPAMVTLAKAKALLGVQFDDSLFHEESIFDTTLCEKVVTKESFLRHLEISAPDNSIPGDAVTRCLTRKASLEMRAMQAAEMLIVKDKEHQKKQSKSLRVIAPGLLQTLVGMDSAFQKAAGDPKTEQDILDALFNFLPLKSAEGVTMQMLVQAKGVSEPAYCSITAVGRGDAFSGFWYWAKGMKMRLVLPPQQICKKPAQHRSAVINRGIPIWLVQQFNDEYWGADSRQKQDRLLATFVIFGSGLLDEKGQPLDDRCAELADSNIDCPEPNQQYTVLLFPKHDKKTMQIFGRFLKRNAKQCNPDLSYVEWAAAEHAGPPDVFISYSWDLDWRFLVAFLLSAFDKNILV